MELTTVWFILIAVLWIGYFTLEGFDFGVGMLLPWLARDGRERRIMINTIGPVWDGNEVWVLTAGGATFAAFPEWYATLFSGFYLPLLLTSKANSPSVSTTWLGISLGFFIFLYLLLGVVDFVLMRRYARADAGEKPAPREEVPTVAVTLP